MINELAQEHIEERAVDATESGQAVGGTTTALPCTALSAARACRAAPSPDDERSTTVTITDAGRALLAKVLPGHVEVVSRLLFEPLSRDDVNTLAAVLAPVRDHMRSTPPRSAAPCRRKGGG